MNTVKRPRFGDEYASLIAAYLNHNFADRSLDVFPKVTLGTTIIGRRREVDLLLIEKTTSKALALECKHQAVIGTADEKIPYALEDIASLRIPGCLVYAGSGWSKGVLHLLESSKQAAYCLPNPRSLAPCAEPSGGSRFDTSQLDHILAMTFGWWDLVAKSAPQQLTLEGDPKLLWPDLLERIEQERIESGATRQPRAKKPAPADSQRRLA